MQIRELDLKELFKAYKIISQLRVKLSYKEFEDLIYDMRYMNYKMLAIIEADEVISYAGVAILTTLEHKRHLKVFDFVSDKNQDVAKYDAIMLEYLNDYAKIGMCQKVVF